MLDSSELKKLQRLVKIYYSSPEEKVFVEKLQGVMDVINQLQDVDCTDVEPLRSVSQLNQRLEKDQVLEKDISKDLFANVPNQGKDLAKEVKCFVVPKVVE